MTSLARSSARDVAALGALLSAGNGDAIPLPAGAGSLSAEEVDGRGAAGDGALDAVEGKRGDGNTGGGGAGRAAVLVILLDDDAVLGDVGEGDVAVGDVVDLAGGAVDGLDADAVLGVGDGGLLDDDAVDGVVGAAADGADGETVAARASTANEVDVGTRVDGEAVVLVLDVCVGDGDARRGADVEGIGVVAAVGHIASRVIDGDVVKGEVGSTVDAEALDRGVLDIQVGDGGLLHGVGIEELGLGLAAVGALAVPPLGAIAVDDMSRCSLDGDLGARDGDQGTGPLLVAEGGGTLEDDGGSILELGQIKGSAGRDGNVVEGDGRARGLGLGDSGSTGRARESAAVGATLDGGSS